jgi:5-deoxy-glucuronate isomerase
LALKFKAAISRALLPKESTTMGSNQNLVHSRTLAQDESGDLVHFSRQAVGWEWMSFCVRRLSRGEDWERGHPGEESVFVLLSGKSVADWGTGDQQIGERTGVFNGLPYALYLSPGQRVHFKAATTCEIAECHVPAEASFPSKLISPQDVAVSLRGGGNVSRQIVDVLRPDFPAHKLMVVEVYTPGGNWSSYPPHKHDVHNPPQEVDLDEIYYYRMNKPGAFAQQRLYNGTRDTVLTVRDGDVVLVRDGYHPVVAGPGYDVYYLNFLAGSARLLAVTEDPQHKWIRSAWPEMDTRLPLVQAKSQ